jgi:hypothetical protein
LGYTLAFAGRYRAVPSFAPVQSAAVAALASLLVDLGSKDSKVSRETLPTTALYKEKATGQ